MVFSFVPKNRIIIRSIGAEHLISKGVASLHISLNILGGGRNLFSVPLQR